MLAEVEAQVQKRCDAEGGGCGARGPMQHLLEGAPPAAFTLQLAWESQRQSSEDIAATMAVIREVCSARGPSFSTVWKGIMLLRHAAHMPVSWAGPKQSWR